MRYLVLLLLAGLAGCGVWTSTIRSDVLDYNGVVTDTIDKYLLVNVLEARDNRPIHFVEMPKITGTLQATASLQGSFPVIAHPVHNGTGIAADTLTPNIGVSSTPTFEVDNLDTKDFATGSTSPIDPKQIQYWYDRGTDHRILLLLFFSSLKITQRGCEPPPTTLEPPPAAHQKPSPQQRADAEKQTKDFEKKQKDSKACLDGYWTDKPASQALAYADCGWRDQTLPKPAGLDACMAQQATHDRVIELRNDPRAAIDNGPIGCKGLRFPPSPCPGLVSFGDYLSVVDEIHSQFTIHSYSEEKLLAKKIAIAATDLSKFDSAKYSLVYQPDSTGPNGAPVFDVYSVPANASTVFCFGSVALTDRSKGDSEDKCSQSTIRNPGNSSPSTRELRQIAPKSEKSCADDKGYLPELRVKNGDSYCEILQGYRQYLGLIVSGKSPPPESTQYSIGFTTRSAGEMVRYLGDILYYQESATVDANHNKFFTLDFNEDCRDPVKNPGVAGKNSDEISQMCLSDDGGYLFIVKSPPDDVTARLSVGYRDKTYAVAESSPRDHTLAVLAVVSHAINLNKSATDIRTTQLLQSIP